MSVSYKWRFVDAYEFTYFGVLKLAQAQDVAHMDYIAISYRWSSDMVAWRDELASTGRGAECGYEERMRRGSIAITDDIESGRGGDNQALARAHLFFTTVAFLVITAGKRYFWMDIVCINQDEPAEKEFFVPRMGSLYRGAAITHVYPTGTKILSTVASEELYFPEWDTRAWTLQEHILSSNVFFCYAFEGVSMTDIVRIAQGESAQIPIGPIVQFPGAPKLVERFRACEWDGASCVKWYKRNDITCLIEKESFHGGFSLSALLELEVTQKGDWSGFHRGVARSSYFKTIFQLRQEGTRISPVRTSLISLGGRRATVPEDMAYCLLGVLGMEDFAVKYDIGFEEARLAMFEAMPEDMLALILGTDWRCNQSSRFNGLCSSQTIRIHPDHRH
ncbi:hypothetical protein A0H81_13305 [Grifola frondosa]|uniref:Heterokaryon incompatibility domain-containing protein n=1 Tax=Grifola frondosa TaxID=5627 RepID=A0A1C7LSC7_GRIFR|nr:hypothetical protein A0H81_13305 [Grifola frondosa]